VSEFQTRIAPSVCARAKHSPGDRRCSHEIEFSFLNGNLMVPAGPLFIFNWTISFSSMSSSDDLDVGIAGRDGGVPRFPG
jgi:hypothetical protein